MRRRRRNFLRSACIRPALDPFIEPSDWVQPKFTLLAANQGVSHVTDLIQRDSGMAVWGGWARGGIV